MKKLTLTLSILCFVVILAAFNPITNTTQPLEVSKEEIHSKMLNSINYFKSAKGNFVYSDNTGIEYTVDYHVKTKDNPSSVVTMNDHGEKSTQSFNEKSSLIIDHEKEAYNELAVPENFSKEMWAHLEKEDKKPKARYQKENGEKVYVHYVDPTQMGIAQDSLYPQSIAMGFLEDYDQWEITDVLSKENGGLHNLDTIIIEGTLNDYYQKKHSAKTFKLWVSKDTGILLNYEEYNDTGDVVISQITKSIKLNQNVKDRIAVPAVPKNYKKTEIY
ncbi:hypothetical protein ACFRCQ_22840 [Cytobacillus firmus]|uniref:hypothetical protein n=1 Tax=Cytobacillus firmus TaxID=1399 RepID=UPI0036B13082